MDCTIKTNENFAIFGQEYTNRGCGGGWHSEAWRFQQNHGIILARNYPYNSHITKTEGHCAHDEAKVVGKVARTGGTTETSIDNIKSTLEKGPLTVAMNCMNDGFWYYSSGILTVDECPAGLDHLIVLVGYSDGSKPEP